MLSVCHVRKLCLWCRREIHGPTFLKNSYTTTSLHNSVKLKMETCFTISHNAGEHCCCQSYSDSNRQPLSSHPYLMDTILLRLAKQHTVTVRPCVRWFDSLGTDGVHVAAARRSGPGVTTWPLLSVPLSTTPPLPALPPTPKYGEYVSGSLDVPR